MNVPAAQRWVLVLLAGLVWTIVGAALVVVAILWLVAAPEDIIAPVVIGVVTGIIIYRWGFSKIVASNLARIYSQAPGKEKVCIFAFQDWKSYLTVTVMMLMGYTLRHLPVAKIYLAPVYIAIGLALLLASLRYYSRVR
jgi:hypothetical protein